MAFNGAFTLLAIATTVGAISALVQFLGLVFQSFNRYPGVAVGEHLGYGLTGVWTTVTGVALLV